MANLPRVKAQRTIFEGNLEGFDHDGIYNLFLTAYDDEQIATDARTDFLNRLVEAKCNAAQQNNR
jgi:hypothetical protein